MNQTHESSNKVTLPGGDTGATTPTDRAAVELKDSVVHGSQDLGNQAKKLASGVADQARKSAQTQISTGKHRAAEGLGNVAEALRHTGDHLRSQDKTGLTEYISAAAEKVEAASGYLENNNLGELVRDVERFARREPALFLGGAFVVGLIGGRFLKSSRPTRASTPQLGQSSQWQGSSAPRSGGKMNPSRPSNQRNHDSASGGLPKSGSLSSPGNPGAGATSSERSGASGVAKAPGAM